MRVRPSKQGPDLFRRAQQSCLSYCMNACEHACTRTRHACSNQHRCCIQGMRAPLVQTGLHIVRMIAAFIMQTSQPHVCTLIADYSQKAGHVSTDSPLANQLRQRQNLQCAAKPCTPLALACRQRSLQSLPPDTYIQPPGHQARH